MEIEKSYLTLPEILERWSMSKADLVYLAENDQLRLSIRVFNLAVELGDYEETPEGERFSVPFERGPFNGLLDLHAHDVFQLFRHGEVKLSSFRSHKADYACLTGERELITVRQRDLFLRREERDRFEAETGFAGAAIGSASWRVPCLGRLPGRPLQRTALPAGCDPGAGRARAARGCRARRALAEREGDPRRRGLAQPQDVRCLQVEEDWRLLIESDGRGAYRLLGL
jgi:hypothetical protein